MEREISRRESLKALGFAAAAVSLGVRPMAASTTARTDPGFRTEEDKRGIFVILATPYTADGELDEHDMAAQVAWLDKAGAHGLVWPQNSSGYTRLSTEQIKRGMEVLTRANQGRSLNLVLGVQRDDTPSMVELARFAERLEPDMMIAMPPKGVSTLEAYREYYEALAGVTNRPVMIQTLPNPPGFVFRSELILDLADRYPHLGYVKEEAEPVFERISALVGKPQIKRVYSAQRGRHFLYDLRHGVDGIVSGMSMYADVFVRMWSEYRAENWDAVRDIHARVLAMLAVEDQVPGAGRYLLKRRGIFRSTSQGSAELTFTPRQVEHIEHNLRALQPYMVSLMAF